MREYKPHGYQKYVTEKMIELLYMGAWLDMGLGKTVCTLTALHELKYHRFCIRKALVIAPKKVAENTWSAEAAKWEHLQDLRLSVVLGTAKQRIAALRADADVYIINRENTQWLVKYYGREWPFDVVILDESTSFKNHQAKRFRALKAVRSRISRLIELTGTPSPRSLMDLWAQVYLLDGGERLGRTISVYREIYFVPDKRSRTTIFSYALKDGAEEAIYKQLSDICISMKSEDYLELPDRIDHDIPVVLDAKAAKAYQQLETNMLLEVGEEEIVTAASRATLTGKLLQLCNGAVYSEIGDVIPIHECKMEVFLETLEQLQGQHVLVYYYFRHDRDRILAALEGTGRTVRVYKGAQEERDWNAGRIDVLLAQPASCGYGLNLQDGGHHIVWFGLTWSLEEYQQANKRLHRQGQKYPVIVHRLIVKGGMDEDVIKSLESKDASQDALIEALKARVDKARRIGS